MMVGVPVLLVVWVSAFVPFVCVMGVAVGVCGWCVFQYWVAVVFLSRRVPGVGVCVSWLVLGACFGVGWLGFGACVCGWGVRDWGVGVAGLVCVSWFRMLTCLGLFPVFWLLSFVCLVNNAAWAGWWFGAACGVCCSGWRVVACGWAMLLLVVWVFRLMWVRVCLCSVV